MKILSDDEFFEGVLGGFAFLVANFIFQKQERGKGNLLVIIIVSWACFWYIRKIGMNLYKQHKKENKISDKTLDIPMGKGKIILIILAMIYFFFIKGKKISFRKITRFSIRDLGLLLFLFIGGFFIYP
jgi:hypothetical protein